MSAVVTFIGLGQMGEPMARNLRKGVKTLYVYNRTKEKALSLIQDGASLLERPEDAFEKGNIVFTMLANDMALEEVTRALLKTIKPGSIHVSMSTVSPELVHKLEKLHKEKGAHLVSAPVFGRPDVAAAGKLWICLAGNPEAKKEVEPLLKHIGQRVEDFGDVPNKANVVKISGNFLILSAVEALGEMLDLGEKNGIDKQKLANFFSETLFPSPVYKTYGQVIAKQAFEPAGFKLALGLKDMHLVRQTADNSGCRMPLVTLLHGLLQEGIAEGRENLDWSAITLSSHS